MKVEGTHDLPFSRDEVWKALMDPALLSRTLPGCEELTPDGESAWTGTMRVQVGPVRGMFKGRLELSDLEPPSAYRMRLEGQGPTGFMDGAGSVRLEETGVGTRLHYDLDFQVGGRIAGVGQRVLDSSARAVARQGLEGLEREMGARPDDPAGPGASTAEPAATDPDRAAGTTPGGRSEPTRPRREPTEAPSQAEMAARIARDVAADLVPPEARGWLAAGFLFFLGLAIGRWWRDRG